jgi:PPM family protein phosphatase
MIVSIDSPRTQIVQEQVTLELEQFIVLVQSYLGRVADVHYFRVAYSSVNNSENQNGLLRVGSVVGGLSRELEIRKSLGTYKLIPDLLTHVEMHVQVSLGSILASLPSELQVSTEAAISDEAQPPEVDTEDIILSTSTDERTNSSTDSSQEEYLDEDYIEEGDLTQLCIVSLSELPSEEMSLEDWLSQEHSSEQILAVIGLVCQVFHYAQQRGWCFVQVSPKFVQVAGGIKFLDLTGVYPKGEKLRCGLMGAYCPPEVAYSSHPIDDKVSTYVIGSLLYHAIHRAPLAIDSEDLAIAPIPRLYQLLKTCLSLVPEDRYPLSQLVSLLVETRQLMRSVQVDWKIARRSTVGLVRSGNEDNYGIHQQYIGNSESLVLGVVADGMGGEAHGELASKAAVATLVEASLPSDLSSTEMITAWLLEMMQKANEAVSNTAQGGSTTLSAVLAVGRELAIAHVGDSRIFLLRNGCICQLSEDHSLPALLLASGQITYEESLTHPDKNQLTKFIGSKRQLSDGYVQDLSQFSSDKTLQLENGDILILCSDGVWDLVPQDQLADIFGSDQALQTSVDRVIESVLTNGAHDNATVLAMKCFIRRKEYHE